MIIYMERLKLVLLERFEAKFECFFFHCKCHVLIQDTGNSIGFVNLRLEAIAIHQLVKNNTWVKIKLVLC